MMRPVRVWITRMNGASHLRVEDAEDARWLLGQLSGSFVFKTSQPMDQAQDSSDCTFRVAHTSQMTGPTFERLLAAITQVQLILEPV